MGVIIRPSGINIVLKTSIWISFVSKSEIKFTYILIEHIEILNNKVNIMYSVIVD